MIEITIKQFLDNQLSVPVFIEKQSNSPQRFILFEKTSGTKKNHIKSGTFAFQSYAESMYEAAMLNEELKQAVENMIQLNEIGNISLNSDYNFTDTETKQYRYQAVFDITYY